jgi:heme-degrading monooxygenase HmoA
MSDHFASGTWQVRPGEGEQFIERWRAFLGWTRQDHLGLVSASLVRSTADPNRFISFAMWRSAEERDAWKASEGFGSRISACRDLCDDVIGGDYERVLEI